MATQKKAKRTLSDVSDDSADESHHFNSSTFPSVLVIKSTDENKNITTLSPFVIKKQLSAIFGTPKSVKS